MPRILTAFQRLQRKKIVLALDGTWQDGSLERDRERSTNIWKLARAINHVCDYPDDASPAPHTSRLLIQRDEDGRHQIVFYQSGVGTVDGIFGDGVANEMRKLAEGATGTGMALKVKEAYLFAARNWEPGDEIFIFGFSRGAYTARTVAALIGDIGLLDKEGQESFWSIYEQFREVHRSTYKVLMEWFSYYRANSSCSGEEKRAAEIALEPWKKKRDEQLEDFPFMIKVLGVFDTVGALGLPGFVPEHINYFGFNDLRLGRHVENAFHAIALNENRSAFPVTKWEFDDNYRPAPGQLVKQVWFAGSHSDIGGGWPQSDLSMITLAWMAGQVKDMLGINKDTLLNDPHFHPSRPWGKLPPHNPHPEGSRISLLYAPRTHSIQLHSKREGSAAELLHRSVFGQNFDDEEATTLWPKKMRSLIEDMQSCSGTVEDLCELEMEFKEKGYFKKEALVDNIVVSVQRWPAKDSIKVKTRTSKFSSVRNWFGLHGPAVRA